MQHPPVWGLGEGLPTPHRIKQTFYEILHRASETAGSCEHDIEALGLHKGEEFHNYLSDC